MSSAESLKQFLLEKKVPYVIMAAWEEIVKQGEPKPLAQTKAGATGEITELRAEFKVEMKALQSAVKSMAGGQAAKPLYSSVAAKAPGLLVVLARRVRESVVSPSGETDMQKVRSGLDLVEEIRKVVPAAMAAQRLQSGEVVVTFESEAERKRWEQGSGAGRVFGQEAKIKTRGYTVIISRMGKGKLSGSLEEIR